MSGSHLSRDLFDLVKSIGECRSKAEEDRLITAESNQLKVAIKLPDVSPSKAREYMIRSIYIEMLGHDASFSHIFSVKQCAIKSNSSLQKRIAYTTVSLQLNPHHPFMLLLINSIQQDLSSDNYLHVGLALQTICKLINHDTLPAIQSQVVKLLDHKESYIRKKAVMCIQRFYTIDHTIIEDLTPHIRRCLCDSNISVLSATLCLLLSIAQTSTSKVLQQWRAIVPDLTSILKQTIDHRLPREYDYHRIAAPWVQLKLIELLGLLCRNDQQSSQHVYALFTEVLKRADLGINVGYAIIYESIRTICTIYPNTDLLQHTATYVTKFLTSENHNLKYLGIQALILITQIDSSYANQHQLIVIDCLESNDITLQHSTIELLITMCNTQNVMVIINKLIEYLQQQQLLDKYQQLQLIRKIHYLAEKYAPSSRWYLQQMTRLLRLTVDDTDVIQQQLQGLQYGASSNNNTTTTNQSTMRLANNLMQLINTSHTNGNDDIRADAVKTYIDIIHQQQDHSTANASSARPVVPTPLWCVIFYTLGEHGRLNEASTNVEQIVSLICTSLLQYVSKDDSQAQLYGITALMKLLHHLPSVTGISDTLTAVIQQLLQSTNLDIQQRTMELQSLLDNASLIQQIDLTANHIDQSFAFLNKYVEHLQQQRGGDLPRYHKPSDLLEKYSQVDEEAIVTAKPATSKLIFTPYTAPTKSNQPRPAPPTTVNNDMASRGTHVALPSASLPTDSSMPTAAANGQASVAGTEGSVLRLTGVQRKWGPSGFAAQQSAVPAAKPATTRPGSTNNSSSLPFPQPHTPEGKPPLAQNGTSATATKPSATAAASKPASAKEKFASSLFAGVGAASAPASNRTFAPPAADKSTAAVSAAPPTATPAASPPPPSQPQAAAVDLLDFASDSPAARAPEQKSQTTDLDMLFADHSSPNTSAMKPSSSFDSVQSTGSSQQAPAQLLSAPATSPLPANSSSPAVPPCTTVPNDDIFGSLMSDAAARSPAKSSPSATSFDLMDFNQPSTAVTASPSLDSALLQPIAHLDRTDPRTISPEHATYTITAFVAYATNITYCVLKFSNLSGLPPQQPVQLSLPSGLSMRLAVSEPHTSKQIKPAVHQLSFDASQPAECTALATISVSDLSTLAPALNDVRMTGSVQNQQVCSYPLRVFDLLRPFICDTATYGTKWKQHPAENKLAVQGSRVRSSEAFMQLLKGSNFHAVQTIGLENIVAAQFISGSSASTDLTAQQQSYVLVHGKLTSTGEQMQLTVRSRSAAISQAVAEALRRTLA